MMGYTYTNKLCQILDTNKTIIFLEFFDQGSPTCPLQKFPLSRPLTFHTSQKM